MIQNGRLSGSKVIKLVHPSKSISWSKKSSSQIYPMVSCNVNLSYSIMISLHPQATNGPQEAIRLSHHCALCSWGFAHACGPTGSDGAETGDLQRQGAGGVRPGDWGGRPLAISFTNLAIETSMFEAFSIAMVDFSFG